VRQKLKNGRAALLDRWSQSPCLQSHQREAKNLGRPGCAR
jgi:hypothetical protein